jgi:hypothetical protein
MVAESFQKLDPIVEAAHQTVVEVVPAAIGAAFHQVAKNAASIARFIRRAAILDRHRHF